MSENGNFFLETHVSKDVLGNYVENLDEFKNAIRVDNKKNIKSEEFNKWMTYLSVYNLDK